MKQNATIIKLKPRTLYVFKASKSKGQKLAASNETIGTSISRASSCC